MGCRYGKLRRMWKWKRNWEEVGSGSGRWKLEVEVKRSGKRKLERGVGSESREKEVGA